MTAPDVPADRVKALRQAFDNTLKDPRFIEAAKKADMYLNPISGEELQQIVSKIVSSSPKVIAIVKEAIKIKDVQELPEDKKSKGIPSQGRE